ncbi:MAG: hypothetical protein LBS55_13325, partial [Prevotellaceae bacterium]|nr:hypothetical protein [Prevotellaceae bacterium]
FFNYPYQVEHPVNIDNIITMPALLSLSAMKAFALGRRAKWKDYVDLYFLIKNCFSIDEISREATDCSTVNFPGNYAENNWLSIKILTIRKKFIFFPDLKYNRKRLNNF